MASDGMGRRQSGQIGSPDTHMRVHIEIGRSNAVLDTCDVRHPLKLVIVDRVKQDHIPPAETARDAKLPEYLAMAG